MFQGNTCYRVMAGRGLLPSYLLPAQKHLLAYILRETKCCARQAFSVDMLVMFLQGSCVKLLTDSVYFPCFFHRGKLKRLIGAKGSKKVRLLFGYLSHTHSLSLQIFENRGSPKARDHQNPFMNSSVINLFIYWSVQCSFAYFRII